MSDPAWLPHGGQIGRAIQRRGMTRRQRFACAAGQAAKATVEQIRRGMIDSAAGNPVTEANQGDR